MSYETIPNRTKKGKKFEYKRYPGATRLSNDIIKILKDNALKYTRTKGKKK